MSIGSTFNSKVMAQASPASPAPKRAKIPSTIRKVTSVEPRPYKYTYRNCQIMTIITIFRKKCLKVSLVIQSAQILQEVHQSWMTFCEECP